MNKKEKNKLSIMFIVIFVIQVLMAFLIVGIYLKDNNPEPKYTYRTQLIELNNTNFGEYIYVVNYICDEGVYVNNNIGSPWFYASTWEDGIFESSVNYGRCFIKIREEVE